MSTIKDQDARAVFYVGFGNRLARIISPLDEQDLVVINLSPENGLPLGLDDPNMVILHARHANGSSPMTYIVDEGRLICPHCQASVNISARRVQQIMDALSTQQTSTTYTCGDFANNVPLPIVDKIVEDEAYAIRKEC
jgi:hypothetical protein